MSFTRYQLFIRFEADAFEDLNDLTRIETRMIDELGMFVKLERHEPGAEQPTITIHTSEPDFSFFVCKRVLESFDKLGSVTVAHQFLKADAHTVLWPENFEGEFSPI